MARRGRYRSYRGSYSYGNERALQYIEDARRLSAELGGMDKEVKAYFFALPPADLELLFTEYGKLYNNGRSDDRSPEAYARVTFPKWRSGSVKMSGMVAERLFNLLPPRMPLTAKHHLVEGLWRHVGPSSNKTLRIGLDATIDEIVERSREHIEDVVVRYQIPDQLERRFQWLAAGDAKIRQELLNHFRNLEKELVVSAARVQVPVLLDHLRADTARYTKHVSQTLIVGKHQLELLLDKDAQGVRLEEPGPAWSSGSSAGSGGQTALWWLLIGGALVIGWLLLR